VYARDVDRTRGGEGKSAFEAVAAGSKRRRLCSKRRRLCSKRS